MAVSACSVTKYIPENEVLYQGADVKMVVAEKIADKSEINQEIESILYPKPNSKILGLRLPLLVHYKARHGKIGFINKFLNKKIGEEPVYMSDVDVTKTEDLIANRLENHGFFRSKVSSTLRLKKKYGHVSYSAEVTTPYHLKQYELDASGLKILEDIHLSMEKTLIKPGSRFDLGLLKAERERIDEYLKSMGYYNFNPDFLLFEADTNQYANKQLDLYLRLKNEVPQKSLVPYRIESIQVFPNYALDNKPESQDTVTISSIEYIQDGRFFKPELLTTYLLLKENDRYDPSKSKLTSQRFSSIGTYKFVNIRHEEKSQISASDSIGLLETTIYLSPLNKRAVRAELQTVVKSNNFAGPAFQITYSNRNLFRGGELLHIGAKIGYETQLTGGKNSRLSSTQYGLNTELIFPRLIPFGLIKKFRYGVPKTKISLGMEYLNRSQLYTLRTLSSIFGYSWRASRYIYHELNPISLNLVNLSNTTAAFDQILNENPFLASSFNQQFIGGLTYNFTYNELSNKRIKNPVFFTTNLDIAGNALNLVSSNTDETGKKTFIGLEFTQYAKADIDLRLHFTLGRDHKIISRLFAGLGIAYGNSDALPFSKQFYAGGPYSVRAFQIRTLGPGTYVPEINDSGSFFDQTGDIRLEGNLEYRFPIYSILKGALFLDAGNVWLRQENDALPGGAFSSNFLNELGVGTGFGLRVDIQNFVIRGDLAAPLSRPSGLFDFEVKQPIFNFAIGYPF